MKPELLDNAVSEILEKLDHKRLDLEVLYFVDNQSTGENIAKYIWEMLSDKFGKYSLKIRVWENDKSYFDYFEEDLDER